MCTFLPKATAFERKKVAKTCVSVTKNVYSLMFHEFCYLKVKLIVVRTRKACEGVASQIHSFLRSTLDRYELSALLSGHLTPDTL
jgi:hypothetical protein